MKTSDEIIKYVESMLEQLQRLPICYVGETSEPGSAKALDGVLWVTHHIWADAKGLTGALFDALQRVSDRNDCNGLPFYASVRVTNPAATETAACAFVLKCWRDVDAEVGVPVASAAGDKS